MSAARSSKKQSWSEYIKSVFAKFGADPRSVLGIDPDDRAQVDRFVSSACRSLSESECRSLISWFAVSPTAAAKLLREAQLNRGRAEEKLRELDRYGSEALVLLPERDMDKVRRGEKLTDTYILLVTRSNRVLAVASCQYGLYIKDVRPYERFEEVEKLGFSDFPVGGHYERFVLYDKGRPSDVVRRLLDQVIHDPYACLYHIYVKRGVY